MDRSDPDALRSLRRAKRLTAEEVAEALGIAPPTLRALEHEELRGYPSFHAEWARVVETMPSRAGLVRIHAASAALAIVAAGSIALLAVVLVFF